MSEEPAFKQQPVPQYLSAPLVMVKKTDDGWRATGAVTTGEVDPAAYDEKTVRFVAHDVPASVVGHAYDLRKKTFTPPPPPPPPPLEDVKREAKPKVVAFIDALVEERLLSRYTKATRDGWRDLLKAAKAMLAGNPTPEQIADLAPRAKVRGETVEAYAKTVVEAAVLTAKMPMIADVMTVRLNTRISAAETAEAIEEVLAEGRALGDSLATAFEARDIETVEALLK